jgi:hypothetical protein
LEYSRIKDSSVIGKKTEQKSNQQSFQFVTDKTRRLKCVMQLTHQLRRFNICGIVFSKLPLLNTKDESESLYILRKFGQSKAGWLSALVKIVQLEVLKIAQQQIARKACLA